MGKPPETTYFVRRRQKPATCGFANRLQATFDDSLAGKASGLYAEGVDVVPQERPVGAHDQHVDDVEADLDVAVGRVAREPGRCRDLKVAALDLAALEAALAVLGCGDVDEDQGVLVVGDQVDLGSLGGSPTGLEKLEALALDEAGGCLDCLLLKFDIAHDDLRLFVAGPFGLPCDPEAAQVLAEGKESSENPAGPEFCEAKVFRTLPEEPGSGRVWRCQGRQRRTSRQEGVLCNGFRMAGWTTLL